MIIMSSFEFHFLLIITETFHCTEYHIISSLQFENNFQFFFIFKKNLFGRLVKIANVMMKMQCIQWQFSKDGAQNVN